MFFFIVTQQFFAFIDFYLYIYESHTNVGVSQIDSDMTFNECETADVETSLISCKVKCLGYTFSP